MSVSEKIGPYLCENERGVSRTVNSIWYGAMLQEFWYLIFKNLMVLLVYMVSAK